MSSSETKKIKYAIFLIKDGYDEFDQIIEEDKIEVEKQINSRFNLNGTIYIGHNEGTQPDWYQKLKEGIEDPLELSNQSTRAVMLIKRREHTFAFVYGHGKHMIKPESYVRGFGMKVVLNNCAVDKLKSIDSSKIDSVTVQARTQTSKSAELSNFQIDDARDLLKAVTAEAEDYDRYGKNIAGRDSFHFYQPFYYENLKNICDMLLDDFHSERYKDYFNWIDHLNEVRDPSLIQKLNNQLIEQLNDVYNSSAGHDIHLAPPEIIEMEGSNEYSYSEAGERFDELDLAQYIFTKKPIKNRDYDFDKLKRDKVFVFGDSDNKLIDKWPIYNCLITELELEDEIYVLSLGIWYSIDNDFISETNSFIQNIPDCPLQFHQYDKSIHKSENDYNKSVADHSENIISMDKKNIVIDGGRFELCDLLSYKKHLIHVKPWKSSSTLSHLFSQGRISAETIINVPGLISQINEKISEQGGDSKYYFDANQNFGNVYTIVYAIIYEGDKEIHDRIPFFSKLNFMDSVKTLRSMSFNVEKVHIEKI